jgi:hypothetical protein
VRGKETFCAGLGRGQAHSAPVSIHRVTVVRLAVSRGKTRRRWRLELASADAGRRLDFYSVISSQPYFQGFVKDGSETSG